MVEFFRRLDPYLNLFSVIIAYLAMLMSGWILLSLFYDIPAPAIVTDAPEHPEAALFVMALGLLIFSKDAAKWYKHKLREEA